MEKLLNEEIRGQVKDLLTQVTKEVKLVLFVDDDCETCDSTNQLLNEVAELSDKVNVEVKSFTKDVEDVRKYNIERIPAFVAIDQEGLDRGIRFYGIPAGHEFTSFLSAIIELGGNESEIPDKVRERIEQISKPVNIKVFVTLGCPHCPGAVQKAHKIAMLNNNVVGEMIEAQTFMELSDKFIVSGVPKIVINDSIELLGNQPIEEFLAAIEKI